MKKIISKGNLPLILSTAITIVASAFVPEIRFLFLRLFRNIPILLMVSGIINITYLLIRKLKKRIQKKRDEAQQLELQQQHIADQIEWRKQTEEKVKKMQETLRQQEILIERMSKTDTLNLDIIRKVILPMLYNERENEVVKRLYFECISIQALQDNQFEHAMISEFQRFYHQKEMERHTSKAEKVMF